MALDLMGVHAKLARSKEHFEALREELASWASRDPMTWEHKVNADSTRYSLILRENESPAVTRWSLIAADCLSNLRAALDHLVYALAVHESPALSPKEEGALAFPITDSRDRFDDQVRALIGREVSAMIQMICQAAGEQP